MTTVVNYYRQTSVVMTLYEINQGDSYDADSYLETKTNYLRENNEGAIPFPVRAFIDTESDPGFTVIEIQAIDRIGLLHDLLDTINNRGLHTMHARIATEKGAALDTFYVQNDEGGKAIDIDLLSALEEDLNVVIGRKPQETARS